MGLINQEILPQGFELVRDRIAEILIEEISDQVNLFYQTELECEIFVERATPVDKSELAVVNVLFAGGNLEQENIKDGSILYQYNVDIYTNSKTNFSNSADNRAAVKAHKLLGVCRSILKNPVYRTLAFAPGSLVSRVQVRQISINENNAQDANSTYMARLGVFVLLTEVVGLIEAQNIEGYNAVVKISNGERGYKYSSE
jgi:hypothetical protein